MMHTYLAYGLGIHSELELPELVPAPADADILIQYARANISVDAENAPGGIYDAATNELQIRYDGIGAFVIRRGCEIAVEPEAQANMQELRLALLGPVFAVLLHQRGGLVLHASAVARDHRAIAFLAEAGGGKSTIAAALLTRGYQLVSDDLVAVAPGAAPPPWVYPGFPFLKIWPQVARALGQDVLAAPRVSAQLEKRVWKIPDAPTSPLPLSCLYVLGQGERPRIEPLAAPESFIALVRHTFVALLLDATDTTQQHFQQCSMLVNQVPVRRLIMPRSLDGLTAVAGLVHTDCSRAA